VITLSSVEKRIVVSVKHNQIRLNHRGCTRPSSGASQGVAVGAISALRVLTSVAGGLGYCEPGMAVIGVSISAASSGGEVNFQSSGAVDISGLSMPPLSWIYLSPSGGVLTASRPLSGVLQIVGKTNDDGAKLTLSPSLPLILA